MQLDVVGVEINIIAKKARLRNERRVTIKEEKSNSDGKFDIFGKNLERVVEILRENHNGITNHKSEIPTSEKRKKKPGKAKEATPNQNIRPPFQEKYAKSSQNNDEYEDNINLIMGIDEENTSFLTQEDQELFELQQLKVESSESFDFKQGYDFAINEIHSQYNLRNKKNNESSRKKQFPKSN